MTASRSKPPEATSPSTPPQAIGSLVSKAVGMLAALTLLTGVVYPLLVTAFAKVAFADQANGSLVVRDGKVVGSRLVGQPFEDPKYFWGRLSATTPAGYNAGSSAATNYGPTNEALTKAAQARIEALRTADQDAHPDPRRGEDAAPIPVDLVTASASGLDPHITPAAALYQVRRVARVRDLGEERVRELIVAQTEGRTLGLLGEPRVNVLALNLALDDLAPSAPRSGGGGAR
jgi:K+-transporting ATPase ATPase C chain